MLRAAERTCPGSLEEPGSKRFDEPKENSGASPIGPDALGVMIRGEYTGPGDASSGFGTALRAPIVYIGASPR